jgi:GntR family galactonate operon transcriptional repressor
MAAPIQFERSQYPEQSLHGRIVHAIGRRIVRGDLRPGDLLPAEPELGAARSSGGFDLEAFVQADMRVHLVILQACRNDLLEQMSRAVYSALLVSFRSTSQLPGRPKASLPKHRAIMDAIRAHDPRGAGAAMRHLVQSTARDVQTLGKRARTPRQG